MDSLFIRRLRRRWRERAASVRRIGIALGFALAHGLVFSGSFGQQFDQKSIGLWLRWGPTQRSTPALDPFQVLVVAVDTEVYDALKLRSTAPWPRSQSAALIDRMREYGVRQVVFDFSYREPGVDPAVDARFAEALRSMPSVIGAYYIYDSKMTLDGERVYTKQFRGPNPLFAESAGHVMLINLMVDEGLVRRFYFDESEDSTSAQTPLARVLGESVQLPTPGPRDFIRYYGPLGTIPSVSAAKVLADDSLKLGVHFVGKVVFVGVQLQTAPGLAGKDTFSVPGYAAPLTGVEIHATIAENLLRGDWIRRAPPIAELLGVNLLGLFAGLAILSLKPIRGVALLALIIGSWFAASYLGFSQSVFLPGLLLVSVFLPCVFALGTLEYYLILRRSHAEIESALGVKLHVRE